MIDAREAAQARLAEQRHVDREGERAEPGIGADVRRRLLAADVLLAGRQRQHEAALASASTVSPHSRPGIWRTYFAVRREQADIGPAEVQRVADRLAFADHDVGAHRARRRDQAERDGLGEHRDQQRAGRVRPSRRSAARSRRLPNTSGVCTTTQDTSRRRCCASKSSLRHDVAAAARRPRRPPCATSVSTTSR